MFRATVCQSSGETTVFMGQLVLVIPCGWLSGMQGGMNNETHIQELAQYINSFKSIRFCYEEQIHLHLQRKRSNMG